MTAPFCHQFRVRYAELDPQGVVFNARYLEYADLVISEYWRIRDIGAGAAAPLDFHIARAQVDFRKPIRAEELIEGRAWTTRFGTSSMTTRIELHGWANATDASQTGEGLAVIGATTGATETGSDDLRAQIELVNVHVDLATGKPLPIPQSVRTALGSFASGRTE